MNEINTIPELTLNPQTPAMDQAQVEAAAQAAQAAQKPVEAPALDTSMLTEAERKSIDEFIQKLDITNPDHVLLFGAEAQKKISDFSDQALDCVRTADTGEVGDMLVNLVSELKGFEADAEEPKGLKKLFMSAEKQMTQLKARYDKVEDNVENIAQSLENYQIRLLKDVSMFDHLYDTNTAYFKELTMYIIAGDEKL